ncbi:MAG: peptide deformylase [Clostridia bacterium]
MAIRNVVKLGDELLRKKSKQVKNFDKNLWQLLDDMRETMYQNDGMGLAAVQVGVQKRAIIVETNGMFLELMNPILIKSSGEDVEEEGCLSVGTRKGYVKRPMRVTVAAQDRFGYSFSVTGEKYLARVLCHEMDHLDGILFVDKIVNGYVSKEGDE